MDDPAAPPHGELHPRAATPRELATERRALFVGVGIATIAIVTIALTSAFDPGLAGQLAIQTTTHLIVGRETGVPTGLALGTPAVMVAALASAHDVTVMLVGYGLVLLAARGSLRIQWLARIAHRPHEKHEQFGARTERVGVTLLALGLWLPFVPGGALIAALLARAAGYRPHVFLPSLAVSAALADFGYVYLLGQLSTVIPPWTLPLAALTIVAVIGAALWVRRRLAEKA